MVQTDATVALVLKVFGPGARIVEDRPSGNLPGVPSPATRGPPKGSSSAAVSRRAGVRRPM